METNQYLKVARAGALNGSKIFVKYFGKAKGIRNKQGLNRNIVTKADLLIEKILRKHISKAFPTHKILGEEFGGIPKIQKNEFIWILDPIDGTNNFAQGIPLCCISIALWDNKGPLMACVLNPITKEVFEAVRGKGTKYNSKKSKVSSVTEPKNSFGGFGWSSYSSKKEKDRMFFLASEKFGKVRVLGSSVLEMCFVASGKMDFFFIEGVKIWDIASGALLVKESGGKITNTKGQTLKLTDTSAIASNGKLHSYILKHLRLSGDVF